MSFGHDRPVEPADRALSTVVARFILFFLTISMQIAYLILAHADPLHLQRLTAKLSIEGAVIFIHVDKKSDLKKFQHIQEPRIIFINARVPVYWGDFSQVQAILNLLDAALTSKFDIQRLVLLSGVDYPIVPMDDIVALFATHSATEFMNAVQMPADTAGKPISRMNNFVVRPGTFRIARKLKRACQRLGLIPKHRDHAAYLKDLVPFGGSTWWAITRDAGEYVRQFVHTRADIVTFFKNVECPDEAFFQTVLMNSPYAENVSRNLTYTDWRAGGSSPSLISDIHIPMLSAGVKFGSDDTYGAGQALFARKFKDGQEQLLDTIDNIGHPRDNPPGDVV